VVSSLAGTTTLAAAATFIAVRSNPPRGKDDAATFPPFPLLKSPAILLEYDDDGKAGESGAGKKSAVSKEAPPPPQSARRGDATGGAWRRRLSERWRGGGIMTGERELEIGGEEWVELGGPDWERSGGAKNPTWRNLGTGSITARGARREGSIEEEERKVGFRRDNECVWLERKFGRFSLVFSGKF